MGAIKMAEVTRSDFIESIHYEKTISIRVSYFVLTYGERAHHKLSSWTTLGSMYVFCMLYVLPFFES